MKNPAATLILTLVLTSSLAAQAPKRITIDHLKSLSIATMKVRDYFDNVHLYHEAARQVCEYTEKLTGTELAWEVMVVRVTKTEVIYRVESAAGTQLAILPGPDACLPCSQHQTHRLFAGPYTTQLTNILSAPKTLRIGSTIDYEIARHLRKGDTITLVGFVELVKKPRFTSSLFDNVVFISNVRFQPPTD